MSSEPSNEAAKKDSIISAEPDEDESLDTPMDCFKSKESCSHCCFGFNNYWKAMIVMAVIVVYLLLGGLFFLLLESPNEEAMVRERQEQRQDAMESLTAFRSEFDSFIDNATNLSRRETRNMTEMLVQLALRFAILNQTIRSETDPTWDYASSVFFASTVITTIGYGTIAPVTAGGQVLFIFYVLLGVPLALIFLSTLGSIISDWLDAVITHLTNRFYKSAVLARGIGILLIVLFTLILFILIPAAIFYVVESPNEWTYLNSVYYCFVTLTTVGFGDFVPGIVGSTISNSRALVGLYRIITAAWVWIGLALVATLISETQELIEAIGKAIHRRAKNRKRSAISMHSATVDNSQESYPEHPAVQVTDETPVNAEETADFAEAPEKVPITN